MMNTNLPDVMNRFTLTVARISIFATTVAVLPACSHPWPKLPPRSYSGHVINGATNQPAAGVIVEATRSDLVGIITLLHGTETIGQTLTDELGRFDLTTREGYSDLIVAHSADRRLLGRSRIKSNDSVSGIVITMEAHPSGVSTGSAYSSEDVSETALKGIEAMVDFIASHPDDPLLSLDGYRDIGVLTAEQHREFLENQRLYFEPHPDVWFHWGEFSFVFNSAADPVQLQEFLIGER